jgi:hypothetical protein
MKLPGHFLMSRHEPEVLDYMTDLEDIDTDYKVISVKELKAFIESRERKAFMAGYLPWAIDELEGPLSVEQIHKGAEEEWKQYKASPEYLSEEPKDE